MPFPQLTVTPSPPTPVSASTTQMLLSSGSPPQPGSGCCESGRPILTDPTTGQTICSCQYLPGVGLIGSAAHRPHAAMAADSLLASAYAAHGYLPFGPDANSICAALGSPYDLKDAPEAIRTLAQSPAYYTYDPSLAAAYPYSYGPLDLNSASRRKNATRENTTTLKAWLYEHRKNPYPTKGEKIMLAIITKMTLTQVSTWFANARRRLKKENKMTWSPRPGVKDDEDDDDDLNESRDSASGHEGERSNGDIMNGDRHGDDINLSDDDDEDIVVDEGRDSPLFHIPHPSRIPLPTEEPPAEMSAPPETGSQSCPSPRPSPGSSPASCSNCPSPRQEHSSQHEQNKSQNDDGRNEQTGSGSTSTSGEAETSSGSRTDKNVNTEEVRKKPKIWSLADVATSRCTPSSSSTTTSSTLPVLHRPGIPSSASQSAGNPALITTGPAYPPLPPHYHNGLRPPWLNGYSIGVAPYMLSSSAFQSQEVAQRGLAPGLVPMGTHVDTRTGLPIATYGVPTAGHPAMIAPPPNLLRIPQPHVPQPHHPQHAHHHPKHAPESLRAPSPHAPPPLPARPLPTHGASSPPRRIPSPSSTSTSPSRPSAPPSSSTTHSSPPSSQSLFTPLNMIKMPSSSHH